LERIAIHLRCRSEEEPGPLRFGDAEGVVRAERSDLQRLDGKLEIVDRARRRSEVQYPVEGPCDIGVLGDVVAYEEEAIVADEMRDIVRASRNEVVQPHDRMAVAQKTIAEVRSEKPGRSGYQNSHVAPPRPIE